MRAQRRRLLWLLPVLAAVYLVVGAVFPFLSYKKVPEGTELLPGLEAMLEKSGDEDAVSPETPVCPDRAMILETNDAAWEERLRLMSLAEDRIILSTFDMRDGESTRDLLSLILKKADEGVDVKILVDGFSGLVRMKGRPLFWAASSHPNIEIRHYNPINLLTPWKTQGRMHDKYVIVDEIGYILGGRNTFDYFLGSYNTESASFDREVLVYNTSGGADSSLRQIEAYFNRIWNLKECASFADEERLQNKKKVEQIREELKLRIVRLEENEPQLFAGMHEAESWYAANTVPVRRICLVANPIGIYAKEPEVFYQLTELMKAAGSETIIHTPYLVCNEDMQRQLREVKEAVPDIRLVFNSVENGDNFFASSDYLYHKKDLLRMEIPLYEYDGGISTHGKSLVLGDRICAVGSYNFDLRSTYLDTELMLVIESGELTAQLREKLDFIEKDCRKAVGEHEYETPPHILTAGIPLWKKIAMRLTGLLMAPFRFLI